MKAAILIRNYNGRELLANLLPGLTHVVSKRGEGDEVLVVDDGSTDGSPGFVEQRFPDVRLVRLSPNSGNSILPVNAGVEAASGDIVICLDSDVLVDSDFITPMLRHFQDDTVFAVCPRIVNPGHGNTVESVNYPLFRRGRLVGMVPGMEQRAVLPEEATEVWYAPGSGAGYHRARFLEMGGLDILYRPFYYEDLDICQRAWRRGWRTIYEPRAVTYHLKHVTTKKSILRPIDFRIYRMKNILLFTWKNLLDRHLMRRHLAWSGLSLARALLTADRAYLTAFLMALRQLQEVLAARRREQEGMLVDDHTIFSRLSAIHSKEQNETKWGQKQNGVRS
ncbi:MAG: glycosyltransferase family 2 protein [bacterium]